MAVQTSTQDASLTKPADILLEKPASAWLVALLLLVSGATALVYQLVWMRELRLIFGGTTSASGAVLAIFMAGLGLGNMVLGKRIDRSTRPLRWYALFELGIAFSAGISPLLIAGVRLVYIGIGGQSALGPTLATVARLLASALVLAIPTFLMGGTMPAAARAVSRESDSRRRGVALVYGLNTLGAVLGAGLSNFVLLESLGSRWTLWSACLVNIALACAAIVLSRSLCNISTLAPKAAPQKKQKAAREQPREEEPVPSRLGLVCLASGTVGFAFFLMEIVWYRMLGPLLGGTTYTFGLILCVALLGIGVGGALYTILAKAIKPSIQLLSLTCAIEAAVIAMPFAYGDQIAMWVLQLQSEPIAAFSHQIENWFRVTSFVILPAAVVAGFQFPLLIAIAGRGREKVGQHVGYTFAANTLGAILGSLAGGFLLLPLLSAPGVWRLVVCLLVMLAVGVVVISREWKQKLTAVTALASLLAMFAIAQLGPTAAWRHAGIGAGRAVISGRGKNAEQDFTNKVRRQCIWEAEGVESSVAITASDSLSFIVNGKNDGNAMTDAGTQMGLGLIGPLLHPHPKQAMVIGLGTGESAGWLADVTGIETVDVVELEPVVKVMAERCSSVNREALKNKKLHLHYNDAREFLLTTNARYDLIISEPSNPYRAGVANLYTQEFYNYSAARLTDQGLFLQWLQAYEVDDETVALVLYTIRSVFPAVQLWRTRAKDLVLVCGKSANAFACDETSIRSRLAEPTIATGLSLAWRADDLPGALSHYVCGKKTIDHLLAARVGPLNTDDRNLLEYAFAKTVGKQTYFSVQKLQQLAIELEDDLPIQISQSAKKQIAQRRLALELFLGGSISPASYGSPAEQAKAEAYSLYLDKEYDNAARQFLSLDIDPACSIDTLVFVHALAETGQPIPPRFLTVLSARHPAEVAAIQAISNWRVSTRQQQAPSTTSATKLPPALTRGEFEEQFSSACKQLREDPWPSLQLLEDFLAVASEFADLDVKASQLVFQELSHPWAMSRMEDRRALTRYIVSEQLAAKDTVAALAPLEPHVPWKHWFLEKRAAVYSDTNHPLAVQAQGDLERFIKWDVEN